MFHYIEFLKSNYAKQNNVTVENLEEKKLKSVTDLAFGKEKSQYQMILMRQWKNLMGICKYERTL